VPTSPACFNTILAALPQPELDHIFECCERVELVQDQLLQKTGEPVREVYFPLDSFILLAAGPDAHDALGVGLVGHEGVLGAWLLLGVDTSPLLARVQGGGSAMRMAAEDFERVLAQCPVLERRLRVYLHQIICQLAQTAVCAVFHVVEVRLAYWLLMIHDCARSDRFYLTHDRLARMLGVRRSGVTTAAGILQRGKLVNYSRGHIVILDRRGLEKASCGCYRIRRSAMRTAQPSPRRRREPAVAVSTSVLA
jgi:CRP-like cAMP-binding protein